MKHVLALCFAVAILVNPFSLYAESSYESLFDRQIQTLTDRGIPSDIVKKFQVQKPTVLKKAGEGPPTEEHIPFLPVIPDSFLSIEKQMTFVKNGTQKGKSHLGTEKISTAVQVPKEPYYIFNVEDGRAMLGRSPNSAVTGIINQDRSPLTVEEGIAIAIHKFDILSDHFVDLPGSRHDDEVAYLWLSEGRPKLNWSWANLSSARWGSASCGSRLVLVP